MNKARDSERTRDGELVAGVRAVPPEAAQARGVIAEPGFSSRAETRPFRDAGWVFASEDALPAAVPGYPVIRDAGGQFKIVAPSINVKFGPDVSRSQVEAILGAEDLTVRRQFGFSANSYLVTGADVLAKAQRLSEHQAIEWAHPTLIEPLGGRR